VPFHNGTLRKLIAALRTMVPYETKITRIIKPSELLREENIEYTEKQTLYPFVFSIVMILRNEGFGLGCSSQNMRIA